MKKLTESLEFFDTLAIDLSSGAGRRRYALSIFELQTKRRAHPIQPESLAGVFPSNIRELRKKKELSREDKYTIAEYTKWRSEVLKIEGINAVNLRAGLRAIGIFDEILKAIPPEERQEIEQKRETLVFYIRNEFDVNAEELDGALANTYKYSEKKSVNLEAFSSYWRDPGAR